MKSFWSVFDYVTGVEDIMNLYQKSMKMNQKDSIEKIVEAEKKVFSIDEHQSTSSYGEAQYSLS